MPENKVLRVELSGGLIGALTTNPTRALNKAVAKANESGWTAKHIDKHGAANLLIWLLQLLVLVMTLGLWTWSEGYLVLLERDSADESDAGASGIVATR